MLVPNKVVAQSDEMGALPILYAATEPGIERGAYVGPDGIAEQHGHPTTVSPNAAPGTKRPPGGSGRSPRR
jgi:hypothetical protein